MVKYKTKLIILIIVAYQYCFVFKKVNCSSMDENDDNKKDDSKSKLWREKWRERSKWNMDSNYDSVPYINVMRGKVREWTNLKHSQPLKRSNDDAGFPASPLTNDLGALNMTNPISKYHCPINLLYGNNLTVKNYFLLVPRGNESCNETVQQIQAIGDETLEYKAKQYGAQAATPEVMTISGILTTSGREETIPETPASLPANTTVETTVGNTTVELESTIVELENTTVELNTTVAVELNTTVSIETNTTVAIETSTPVALEINTTVSETAVRETSATDITTPSQETTTPTQETTTTPIIESSTLAPEIMRTLDKYCQTFNMSDLGTYTIQPVSINIGINSDPENKGNVTNNTKEENTQVNVTEATTNSMDPSVLKKQKRTPKEGATCANFSWSGDQNYTINPIPLNLLKGNKKNEDRKKVVGLKKQKQYLSSRCPKKRKSLTK